MTDNKTDPLMYPWVPMKCALDLKIIGKLGEEINECGSAICRCIIQGIDEREPVTNKLNREWLQEEISDVYANILIVNEHFGTVIDYQRVERKIRQLKSWHYHMSEESVE